ncbi:hypothetical protein GCM10009676_39300 [Prauserella halophila]|uniref:Uncharacterized protein n=1 Tax=Prauserella halophila TaxID=185641 RepID=A0ABN1WGE5_9PSEU
MLTDDMAVQSGQGLWKVAETELALPVPHQRGQRILPRRGLQPHVHMRILDTEATEKSCRGIGRKRGLADDVQATPGEAERTGDRGTRRDRVPAKLPRRPDERLSCGSKNHPPPDPVEKLDAQFTLKGSDSL